MYLKVSPYLELLEGIPVALQVNEGIIKLTGRDGVGKSALCQALSELLAARGLHVLYFPAPPATVDILEALIRARFALETGPNFTKQLTRHLREQSGAQRQLHVIFDDAQDISEPVFNSIRMLCNIQDEHQALVKPIICGSAALDRKLTGINYRSVSQYLSQSFTLSPMTIEQLKNFYWAYWRQQGLQVQPPGNTVINNLFKESQGFPGPVLARLGNAYQRVLDRRQGRSAEQALVKPGGAARRSLQTRLGLGFGCVLIGVGVGLVYLYDRADTGGGSPMLPQVPASEAMVASTEVPALAVTEPAREPVAPAAPVAEPGLPAPTPAPEEPEGELEQPGTSDDFALVPTSGDVTDAGAKTGIDATASTASESVVEPAVEPAAEALLASWTSSWQARDVEGYLGHYHPDFQPANGDSLDAWQQQRRGSLSRAMDIRISYDSIEFVAGDDSSITLQFWLHYSASNYADDTLKELVLLKSADGLRIRREQNLLVEQPQ